MRLRVHFGQVCDSARQRLHGRNFHHTRCRRTQQRCLKRSATNFAAADRAETEDGAPSHSHLHPEAPKSALVLLGSQRVFGKGRGTCRRSALASASAATAAADMFWGGAWGSAAAEDEREGTSADAVTATRR